MLQKATLSKCLTALAFLFVTFATTAQTSSFTVNSTEQCVNVNNFVFTNTSSSPAAMTYTWSFGDGTTSTIASPSHSYAAFGNYNVQLIMRSSGIDHYSNQQITVNPMPVASFTNLAATFGGNSYTFISTSTIANGVMNYLWSFGDGSTSTLVSPTHTFANAGTYNVTLTVTSDAGCSNSVTQSLVITLSTLASNFAVTSADTQTLAGNNFTFNNVSSSGAGITYLWEFGDGTTSTLLNPTHTYTYTGLFTVILNVMQAGFNTAVSSHNVFVLPAAPAPPVASFSVGNTSNAYTFTSTSTNAVSFLWDLGDGTTSTSSVVSSKVYSPGTYTIKLVVTSSTGAMDSTSQTIIVAAPVSPVTSSYTITSASSQCLNGNSFTFNNTSSSGVGITYLWNFGDGLTSTATSPSHTYTTAGTYSVTLSVLSAGGNDISSQSLTVKPSPSVSFNTSNTLSNYTFTNSSSISSGTLSYAWSFGDGGTAITTNASHTYAAGTYTVKLIATGSNGCVDSSSATVTVLPAPTAAFTVSSATTQCTKGNVFTFNNTSTSGAGVTYHWDFGDNSTHNIANPTKTYSNPGTYIITLTVTSSGGSSSTTQSVTVNPSPSVSYSASVVGSVATFTNSTTISAGTVTYSWDFADGITSILTNPIKAFADGSFGVKLIATSNLGCKDSVTQTVVVGTLPTAAFTVSSATSQCSNSDNFTFSNTSTSGVGVTYLWNFGDGTTSILASPTKSYTGAGTFTITLTVTSAVGSVTTSQNVTVLAGPTVVIATYGGANSGNSYTFVSNSSVPAGTMTYYWSLGDGTLEDSTVNVTHTYAAPGTYVVKLVVVGSGGCSDSSSTTVTVCPKVTAGFNVTSSTSQCLSTNSFTFLSTSTNTAGIPAASMSYAWSFGDSTFSSLQTPPAHTYASFGDYDVKLVVTLVSGACTIKDSITKLKAVSAEPMPVASYRLILDNFYVPTALLSDTTKRCWHHGYDFSYQSSSTLDRGKMDYFWHFGTSALFFRDGDSSHYINPRIVFDTAGTYPVKLVVVSDKGCMDSVTRIVLLSDPHSRFNFTVDSTTDVYAAPVVSVTDASYDYGGYLVGWNWNFGGGVANSSLQAPAPFSYACGGNHSITLQVTSNVGCTADTTRTMVLRVKPKAIFSISAANYTPNVYARPTFTYTNATTVNDACATMSYAWNFGDLGTSTLTSPTHIYAASGTYTTTLIATNSNGGAKKDTTTRTVLVAIKPRALFSTSQTLTPDVYASPTVTYTNSTTSLDAAAPVASLGYAWDFGDGTVSSLQNPPTHQYASGGTYVVSLTVTNPVSGLTDVISHNVVISVKPKALFSSDVDYAGDVYSNPLVTFTDASTVNDAGTTLTYAWDFGDATSSALQNPTHTYAAGGTYNVTLTVTNTNGGLTDAIAHSVVIVIKPQAILSVHSAIVSTPVPMSIGNADYKVYTITGLTNGVNPSTVVTGSIAHTEIIIDSVYIPALDSAQYADVTDADVTFGIQNDTLANYRFRVTLIVTSNLGVKDTAYAELGAAETGFTAFRGVRSNVKSTITLPSIGTKGKHITQNPITSNLKGFLVYPNPSKDNLTVRTAIAAKTTTVSVKIYGLNGKLMQQQMENVESNVASNKNFNVNISNLAAGTYTIVLTDNKGNIVGNSKFVKTRD